MSSTSSSGGHFHRRWGSAGSSTSRTSPLGATALSSTVEPSTYGTSWNSVRWNKPVTPGYRSQSSRIAQSFERDKPSSSYYLSSSSVPRREVSATADKYLNSAAKTAANLASLGPSVSSRASRFDATVADKYRSEARDLISKYTSKERPSTTSAGSTSGSGYYSRHFEPQKLSVSNELTSPRTTSYASTTLDRDRDNSASRYSVGRDYGSYRKSASVTPTRSSGRYSETRSITSPGPSSGASSTHVLKSERPWRQRMAESARVRTMHGEDVSASYLASRASRRTSIGRGEADDLSSSISALRDYVAKPAGYRSRTSSIESRIQGRLSRDHSRESIGVPMSSSLVAAARKELAELEEPKAMSRSYSPVRSKENLAGSIPRFPTVDIAEMMDKHRASSAESKEERRGVSTQPKDEPIKEEEWRDKEKERKRSMRERSEARILSRQSSVGGVGGDSSEEDHERDKEEARRKRRASRVRRSRTRDQQSMERTNGKQEGDAIRSPSNGAEEEAPLPSPGPLSPKMGGKVSRSASSKKMVPTKTQSIKSPCLVEVGGPSTTVVSTPLSSPIVKEPAAAAVAVTPPAVPAAAPLSPTTANMSYDEISGDTDEAIDDESQYNAVTHFKRAFKPKVKPIKPVPGTWKKDDEKEENISKNKTIERPSAKADTAFSWKGPLWASTKKALRVKPKAVIKKEKEAAKEALKEAEKKAKEEARLKKEEEKMKREEEKRLKKEEERKRKEKEKVEETKCSITLECPKERGSVTVEKKMVHPQIDSASCKLREKRPKPASTCLDEVLRRKAPAEKCERKWKSRSAPTTVSLQCSSSSTSECSLRQSIDRKEKEGERQAAAKVHVLSGPIDGVTMSRVRLRVRAALKDEKKRQSLPIFPSVLEIDDDDEKAKRSTVIIPEEEEEPGLSRSNSERDSRAAMILNEMRVKHPRRTSQDSSSFLVNDPVTGPLVLPDKSILEEYVKRKRGKLEELRGSEGFSSSLEQVAGLSDSFYRTDSPADSTCSDLLPAPEVRIYAHSPRHSAHITSSRRSSCSRLSDCETATPTNMLDTLQPLQQSSPQPSAAYNTPGFLRHGGRAVTLTAKPLPFDTPKTPFEATLQNQANRIRKANLVHQDSTASTTSLDEASMQRSGLVSSFNASIAGHARPHERYAAHLPHRSGELSGRTSATSLDSVQSGTLDAASKHVDNMIDQARFKHQAHRSKFKEAIDYLDNIFEDLKKEVDPSAPSTANASPGPSRAPRKTSSTSLNGGELQQHQSSQQAAVKHALQREAMQKAAARGAAAAAPAAGNGALTYVASTSAPSQSNSLPNRAQRHRQQPITTKEPSPVEMSMSIRPVQKIAPPEDLEVSETLVLPRKTDKLDFTRRWLQDDLAGFTKTPPQMVEGPNTSMYSDPDEHSLGSCSAEVAAINNTKQKKRRESKPKVEKPQQLQQTQPEKKLAPYRPQPVYGQPTNGTGARFPLDVSECSLTVPGGNNSLSRVASYDRLSERLTTRHSDVWRAASQEPYQTLGSVRSEDASSRPSPSAFQNVPAFQRGGLRGSIKSLPDAGLVVKTRHQAPASHQPYYPEPPRDPAMAIDALVAELELNTDQNGNATDKRRSFPTALGTAGRQQLQHVQQAQRVVPATAAPAHQMHVQQQQQQRYAPQPQQQQSRPVQQSQPQQQYVQLKSTASRAAPVHNGSLGRSKNGHHMPSGDPSALDEVTHMLQAVSEFPAEKPKKNGSSSSSAPFAAAPNAAACSRPFDTINQERINPSRVEAIQNMFESRRGSGPGYGNDWRSAGKKNSREEDAYYDISEYSTSSNPPLQQQIRPPRPSPPPHRAAVAAVAAHPTHAAVRHSPSGHGQMMGAVFQQGAPLGRNGSAGSSQNGGYYSSNSSCAVGPTTSYHQSGSAAHRQSISSRAPSVEDEDDGFYDNIGIYGSMNDDRRFSRGSELGDTVSMSSARLPPSSHKPTRIGSFLSKLGARSSGSAMMRQPGNAASLVSLNKVAMEPPMQQRGSLVKSSSLSNDPWRKEVIEGSQGKRGSSTGLGARLKNSLFGSKKRLN